ncbi:uncharacterized protein BJ212DRAFT_1585910 [Suillus subaureus]|uniref:Uncharacterized protein n=1 Tax=Suillus subaureus TaxID=48587 RepID=A0A9P7EH01_9AGAM|nr:uncharacterized protein BJ212DRAFT_1585910 [Suillus subaureus]KAG1820810.1 hypothetical protein BJ212DRAFT_1585910 [Suillus subaureus]
MAAAAPHVTFHLDFIDLFRSFSMIETCDGGYPRGTISFLSSGTPGLQVMSKKTSDLTHSLSIPGLRLIGSPGNPSCIIDHLEDGLCDAAHLVDVRGDDKDKDVDDLQNGLFLCKLIPPSWGFLPVSNVYMTSNDIDNIPPANSSLIPHDLELPMSALELYTSAIPDGSLVYIASHDWVPNLLADAIFAEVMCRSWGLPGFVENMVPDWSI